MSTICKVRCEVRCEVLSRRIKRGWLWDSYFITVRLLDEGWSINGGTVSEIRGDVQNYWDMEPGDKGHITLHLQRNGKYGLHAW